MLRLDRRLGEEARDLVGERAGVVDETRRQYAGAFQQRAIDMTIRFMINMKTWRLPVAELVAPVAIIMPG